MWDWITFGIVVASVIPSALMIGFLLKYLLKNSERRCFKDASEDCEILVSTNTVRPRITTHELLQEFTHRQVAGSQSMYASQLDMQLVLPEAPPPEYSAPTGSSTTQFTSDLRPPPLYGSHGQLRASNSSGVLSSVSALYSRLPSLPINLNLLITSQDLLPEFATLQPPPSYDEAVRG